LKYKYVFGEPNSARFAKIAAIINGA